MFTHEHSNQSRFSCSVAWYEVMTSLHSKHSYALSNEVKQGADFNFPSPMNLHVQVRVTPTQFTHFVITYYVITLFMVRKFMVHASIFMFMNPHVLCIHVSSYFLAYSKFIWPVHAVRGKSCVNLQIFSTHEISTYEVRIFTLKIYAIIVEMLRL